jgi:hypothetical protein
VDRCDTFSLYLIDTVVVWQTHRLKLAFLVQRYTLDYVPQELNSQDQLPVFCTPSSSYSLLQHVLLVGLLSL